MVAKERKEFAADASEILVMQLLNRVFTLSVSPKTAWAWLEIEGSGDKVLIDYPLEEVGRMIVQQIEAVRIGQEG